ncbi:2619_t:CDS:2, partial [Scutellospora calospora]
IATIIATAIATAIAITTAASIAIIVLNDIIQLNTIDPNDLPAFSLLINITTLVQEDLKIENEDITINISVRNYIDQDYINIEIICYYLTSTQSTRVKKNTRQKKTSITSKPYLKIKSHSKVTDLVSNILNNILDPNISNQTTNSSISNQAIDSNIFTQATNSKISD